MIPIYPPKLCLRWYNNQASDRDLFKPKVYMCLPSVALSTMISSVGLAGSYFSAVSNRTSDVDFASSDFLASLSVRLLLSVDLSVLSRLLRRSRSLRPLGVPLNITKQTINNKLFAPNHNYSALLH